MIFFIAAFIVLLVSGAILIPQFLHRSLTDEPLSEGWGVKWW